MYPSVDLKLSQIIEDLNEGLTWYKTEDVGYGSIQEKYQASTKQIDILRKHPKLVNLKPNIIIFNVIDDLPDTKEAVPPPPGDAVPKKVSVNAEPAVASNPVKHTDTQTTASSFMSL